MVTPKIIVKRAKSVAAAITAHAVTKAQDAREKYRRILSVPVVGVDKNRTARFLIKKVGGNKQVIELDGGYCLAVVPAEKKQLSMGFVLDEDAEQPITNRETNEVAKLPGAGMYSRPVGVALPTEAIVHPGMYKLEDHPGDTSWQSADGTTVVSWWQAGRYATSMQYWCDLLGLTALPPLWAEMGETAEVGAQTRVLAGTPPYAYDDPMVGTSAASELGIRGIKLQYGVWKNGELLDDSQPALCHMLRKEKDSYGEDIDVLISLWGDAYSSAGGYALHNMVVRFRTYPTGKNKDPSDPEKVAGTSMVTCPVSFPGDVKTWFNAIRINGFVIVEIPYWDNDDLVIDSEFACYGKFSPDGMKLMMYGVTSKDDSVAPTVRKPEWKSRTNGIFTLTLPAAMPAEPVSVPFARETGTLGPSIAKTSVEVSTYLVPPPPDTDTVTKAGLAYSECVGDFPYGGGTGLVLGSRGQGWWSREYIGHKVTKNGAAESSIMSRSIINRTYDELLPFVDWSEASALLPVRSIRTAHRDTSLGTQKYNVTTIEADSYLAAAAVYYTTPRCDYSWTLSGATSSTIPADLRAFYISNGIDPDNPTTTITEATYVMRPGEVVESQTNTKKVPIVMAQGGSSVLSALVETSLPIVSPSYYIWVTSVTKARWVGADGQKVESCLINFPTTTAGLTPGVVITVWNPGGEIYMGAEKVFGTGERGYYRTDTESAAVYMKQDRATVGQKYLIGELESEEHVFFAAESFRSHWSHANGDIAIPSITARLNLTVEPVQSEPLYVDPRWPVVSLASEKPFIWVANSGRRLAVGSVVSSGGSGGLPTMTCNEILTDPNNEQRLLPVNDSADMRPIEFRYGESISSGDPSYDQYVIDLAELGQIKVGSYPSVPAEGSAEGVVQLAPRNVSGFERIYKYDISPDTLPADKVLFGASWPFEWKTEGSARPEMWTKDGKVLPLSLGGVYSASDVVYSSPIFLSPYLLKE